jgi:natural product precursor
MKKQNGLKLNKIGMAELEKREMINLRGGTIKPLCKCEGSCSCSDDPGHGSVYDSNWMGDLTSNGKSVSA